MTRNVTRTFGSLALLCLTALPGCHPNSPTDQGVLDEARGAHRDVASFPAAGEDYFHDMDGGIALTADQIKGRNTWNSA